MPSGKQVKNKTLSQLQVKFFSKREEYFAQSRQARKERPNLVFFFEPRLKGFLGVIP